MATSVEQLGWDYSAAWSSKSPATVAAFFAEDGEITINGGQPMKGRKAIADMAAGFYSAFPDLVVRYDGVRVAGRHVLFLWTLEGRHAQTNNFVTIGGWEEWDLDDASKVTSSLGWFDIADYEGQIAGRARTS